MTNYLPPAGRERLVFRPGARFSGGPPKAPAIREQKRGTSSPEEADDDGTAREKIRKVDETAAPASQPKQGRRLASLYGFGDAARFGEHLDRAPHGVNHLYFGVRLVITTACVKLRLQRHRRAPDERGGTPGAFLIPADLRQPSCGNIVYSEGE
jgi:hypothetical protein